MRGERIIPDDVTKLYEVNIKEVHKTVVKEKGVFQNQPVVTKTRDPILTIT